MINHDVEVVVVEIRGDKVRLGIVAPKEVSVHRKEVFDLIQSNKPESIEPPPSKEYVDRLKDLLDKSLGLIDDCVCGSCLKCNLATDIKEALDGAAGPSLDDGATA